MCHRFLVEEHRNLLRFLRYKDKVVSNKIVDYRLKVHVLGKSPSQSMGLEELSEKVQKNMELTVCAAAIKNRSQWRIRADSMQPGSPVGDNKGHLLCVTATKPLTHRGFLSMVNGVFDPLGFLACYNPRLTQRK